MYRSRCCSENYFPGFDKYEKNKNKKRKINHFVQLSFNLQINPGLRNAQLTQHFPEGLNGVMAFTADG